MSDKEKDQKTLEKFKKDYDKLAAKYPLVLVSNDIRGHLIAYLNTVKVRLD